MFRLALILLALASDPGRRDIRDYGAIPGPANAAVTRAAIQAAIDSILARPKGNGIDVYIPPDLDWVIDQPLFGDAGRAAPAFAGNWRLVGDGPRRSTLRLHPSREGSVLYLGITRSVPFTPDHWVDAFGKLDATAAPNPGARWALRTKGDAHVAFGASAMHRGPAGDYWASARAVTVELAIDGPSDGALCGASRRGDARPFLILSRASDNDTVVAFSTADGTLTGARQWIARFPRLSQAPDVHRLRVQLDLAAGSLACWLDDVPAVRRGLTVDGRAAVDADLTRAGTFATSQGSPFLIGTAAATANAARSDHYNVPGQADLVVLGLRVSAIPRYVTAVADPPAALRRLDGRAITDRSSFFEADPATLFYLRLDDDPSQAAPLRRVAYGTPGSRGFGLWLGAEHARNESSIRGVAIRGVGIEASPFGGECLTVGFALDLDIDDCLFARGDRGLGSWNFGANYKTHVRNSTFSDHRDAAVYANMAMMNMSLCRFPSVNARTAIWNAAGSLTVRDCFFEGAGVYQTLYRGTIGADASFDGLDFDHEAVLSPTVATFYSEASRDRGASLPAGLMIRGFHGGGLLRDRPVVRLVNRHGDRAKGHYRVEPPWLLGSVHPALVEADAGWEGEVMVQPGFPAIMPREIEGK